MWLALLVACTQGPSEAQRYHDALAATDWPAARAACGSLAGDVGHDCMVAVMDRLGVLEREACDAMPQGSWKDECLFRYAERVAAAGDVAAGAAACTQVRYARECSFHLVRNAARTVLELPLAQAAPALDPWRTALAAAPDAPRLFWKTYFREGMSRRPVDPGGCPDLDCKDGAREAIFHALSATARQAADFCEATFASDGVRLVEADGGAHARWAATPMTEAWVTEWRAAECARRLGGGAGGERPHDGPGGLRPQGSPPPHGGSPPRGGPPPHTAAPVQGAPAAPGRPPTGTEPAGGDAPGGAIE